MGSTIYTKVFVLAFVLISNILGNNFIGYIPHYLHFVLSANVTDQVAHSHRYISRQRRPSVLRDPHQIQMNLKYRVRAPSVFRHPLSLPPARLLKPSPVRRGLQPSQTGTVNWQPWHATDAYGNPYYLGDNDAVASDFALVHAGFLGAYGFVNTNALVPNQDVGLISLP